MYLGYSGLRGIADLKPDDPKIEQVDYYNYVADKVVPRLAELHFRRLMMVLPRAPWNWPIEDINHLRPEYTEPFKRLCDVARRHGISMIAWYGSVQTWTKRRCGRSTRSSSSGDRTRSAPAPTTPPGDGQGSSRRLRAVHD